MNNIHEDDWAEDSWSRHSGMYSYDDVESKEQETISKEIDAEKGEQPCPPSSEK